MYPSVITKKKNKQTWLHSARNWISWLTQFFWAAHKRSAYSTSFQLCFSGNLTELLIFPQGTGLTQFFWAVREGSSHSTSLKISFFRKFEQFHHELQTLFFGNRRSYWCFVRGTAVTQFFWAVRERSSHIKSFKISFFGEFQPIFLIFFKRTGLSSFIQFANEILTLGAIFKIYIFSRILTDLLMFLKGTVLTVGKSF